MYANGTKKFETAISLWMEALEVSGSTIRGCDALSLNSWENYYIYCTRAHLMCTLGYRASTCSRHGQPVEDYRKNGIKITVYLYCDSLVENSTRTGGTGTAV